MAEVFGAVAGAIGIAVPLFNGAKTLRDRYKRAWSEKKAIQRLLDENERDMALLEDLYVQHKDVMDAHELSRELKALQGKLGELEAFLNSVDSKGRTRHLPNVKDVWRSGDVSEKIKWFNDAISSACRRLQLGLSSRTLGGVHQLTAQSVEHQEAMQAQLAEIMVILRSSEVRRRSRTLSLHSQVDSDGSESQPAKVLMEQSSTTITISILSMRETRTFDCEPIKMSLQEYRRQLDSDSPTIEFMTDKGKTVICRKEDDGLEGWLDEAERLLQEMLALKEVSTLVVVHRLRDLARVLDSLKLEDECRLAGNCALNLAYALTLSGQEFRSEQASVIQILAPLLPYSSQRLSLFKQSIMIWEELVNENSSTPNRAGLISALCSADYHSSTTEMQFDYIARAMKQLEHFNPVTVYDYNLVAYFLSNRSIALISVGRYSEADKFGEMAVEKCRELASSDTSFFKHRLAHACSAYGHARFKLGRYQEAVSLLKESVDLFRGAGPQSSSYFNKALESTLMCLGAALYYLNQYAEAAQFQRAAVDSVRPVADGSYGNMASLALDLLSLSFTLYRLDQFDEAMTTIQEATSLYQQLLQDDSNEHKLGLCTCFQCTGLILAKQGRLVEAIAAYHECISLSRELAAQDPQQHRQTLSRSLHELAYCLQKNGQIVEAEAVATECIQLWGAEPYNLCEDGLCDCRFCIQARPLPDAVLEQVDAPTERRSNRWRRYLSGISVGDKWERALGYLFPQLRVEKMLHL